MNKTELIAAAAEAAGLQKKDADRLLNAAIDIITKQLSQGEKVQLSGFGTFECKDRKPRTGRNPHTRQAVSITLHGVKFAGDGDSFGAAPVSSSEFFGGSDDYDDPSNYNV